MATRIGRLVVAVFVLCLAAGYTGSAHPLAATEAGCAASRFETGTHPPAGYEGALDDLRPVVPILYRPLNDPIGVTVNAAGNRAYVIEKGLHRLAWVDIDPASPSYASINEITAALDDPQMAVSLDADETHAYVVENTPGTLQQVRLSDGEVTTIATDLQYPIDLALSPDASTAYVTQFYDPTLVSVDLASGSVVTVTTGLEFPAGIALSPDGLTAYVAELTVGPLHQVDLATGTVSDASSTDVDNPYDIAVDADGGYAYLPNYWPRLERVDLNTSDVQTLCWTDERTEGLALSPDGSTLYAVQRGVGRLLAIDLGSATPESIFPVLQEPQGLTLNQSGTRLYILEEASGDLSVQDVDPASSTYGRISTVAQGILPHDGYHGPHFHSVGVNLPETWALVPYNRGLRQVSLDSGAVVNVVEETFNQATGIALTADGTTAYVGDQEAIWRVRTADWSASRLTTVPMGAYALALNPQEDTVYGVRHLYNEYDLAPMVSVRLADGLLTEIPASIGSPGGLAMAWDGKHAFVSDLSEGGRLWWVDLSSGDSQLIAHVTNWTMQDWCRMGGVAVGVDNMAYVPVPNVGDNFVRHGVIYAVRPGDAWRLSILYDNPFHFPEDQAISVDGNWLYVLSANSMYRVNLSGGADHGEIATLVDGHIEDPRGVAVANGDSVWVLAAPALHKISASDGSLLQVVNYHHVSAGAPEHGLGLSADGSLAYFTTNAGELVEVNLTSGGVRIVTNSLSSPYDAAVNDAGTQVYVAERELGRLSAVDVASGAISVVSANLEHPVSVALDEPHNQALVLESPYPYHYISEVDLSTGAVTRVFTGERNPRESPRGLSLTPDHSLAYYNRPVTGEIWGIDLASGVVVDHLYEGINGPHGIVLSGGETGAYTVSEFVPRIRYVDFGSSTVSTAAVIPGSGRGLAVSQDEDTAYVTLFYDDQLVEVDLTAKTSSSLTAGCMNGRVVLDPTETVAYVTCGGAGGTIWAVDLGDGSRTALVTGLHAPQSAPTLDINAAGTMLYSTVGNTGELGDFHLYAIAVPTGTTTLITTLEEAQAVPGDVTLSPDERHIYVVDTPGNWIGAGVQRVDVDPTSPTYGEVVSLASWMGELQHGEFTSDGRNLVISNAQMNQLLSLCLAHDCIPLEADFSASPLHGTAPLAVDFRNLSRGDYTKLGWDFGDGGTSAESDPTHVFRKPGTFAMTLTITGTGGSDTETKAACIQVRAELCTYPWCSSQRRVADFEGLGFVLGLQPTEGPSFGR